MIGTSWYMKIGRKIKHKGTSGYIAVRKKFLYYWTKISEERRKIFFTFFHSSFNYFQNALLLSVPVSLLTDYSYFKAVIIIWFSLPFFEHYYLWLRETWRDDLIK